MMMLLKSFSKSKVDTLIFNIIESLETYPRDYLFINSNNERYSDDGFKKMLKDITNDKNIGVNSLLSAYVSHYLK
jgi:site-specific recombinase XerD